MKKYSIFIADKLKNNIRYGVLTLIMAAMSYGAVAQRFYELRVPTITTDTVLPHFATLLPLSGNYQDSVYSFSIRFPEWVVMPATEQKAFAKLYPGYRQAMPEIEQAIVTQRKKAQLKVSLMPVAWKDGQYHYLKSFVLQVNAKAKERPKLLLGTKGNVLTRTAATPAQRYVNSSRLASGKWVKIKVKKTGVYKIDNSIVKAAGFTDINKIKVYGQGGNLLNEQLTEESLMATDDLHEVPTLRQDGCIFFYGKAGVYWQQPNDMLRIRNPYSDEGYYFITENDETPLVQDHQAFINGFYPDNSDYHQLHEKDEFAWFEGGRNLFENTPIPQNQYIYYTLPIPVEGASGKLLVRVSAGESSTVEVSVNDKVLGTIRIIPRAYDKGYMNSGEFNLGNLSGTEVKVGLKTLKGSIAQLDFIDLYHNKPQPAPQIAVDTTPTVEIVGPVANQNRHGDDATDMIIIIPESGKLRQQAERLKAFHESYDGMRVRIVTADELYNEFSSGTPDAGAYRNYIKMLYDRATTESDMPRHLLLFGDCLWDNRGKTVATKNLNLKDYLLCFESEDSFSEVYCYVDDGFFCNLDDGEGIAPDNQDLLDMSVGRFPVTTESNAKIMVDKTIAYAENKEVGAWQNQVVFLGDDGDYNLHMRDVNETTDSIAALYPDMVMRKIIWDAYKRQSSATGYAYPDVEQLVKRYQKTGALIIDYGGHGRPDQISHEKVLSLLDFKNFSNTALPLWITASCDIMPYDGTIENIGESVILNPQGGSMAIFGTARTVYASQNKRINNAFLKHVLSIEDGKPLTLGEAQRRAKNEMITEKKDLSVNKLQYALLGDPALRLKVPTQQVVLDSINDVDVHENPQIIEVEGGKLLTITGHVKGMENSSGVVTAMLRNELSTVTCLANDPSLYTALTYQDRVNTIFTGSNKLQNGRFKITVAVPSDVTNEKGTAIINLFAFADDKQMTANGRFERVQLKACSTETTDNVGPSIYSYLNSTAFVNGDKVNATPYFVAELHDDNGLNVSGNGVGHDLKLVIDNDPTKQYILNDAFAFDFGSHTTGKVGFPIPALTAGKHSLTFMAWDVFNNVSASTLQFEVSKDAAIQMLSVGCTDNPASVSTQFFISHNMLGSEIMTQIEVFDMSGRKLWNHEEKTVNNTGTYSCKWDLCTNNGIKLDNGIYIYRISVQNNEGKRNSKSRKIIIVGNK